MNDLCSFMTYSLCYIQILMNVNKTMADVIITALIPMAVITVLVITGMIFKMTTKVVLVS